MDNSLSPPTPVAGIGASAGGIEAFRGFFENMPPDSGLAFVVVLHLPADRKSILPEILRRWTTMPVIEATDDCPVEANCIYIPPPGIVVTFHNGRLHLHRIAPSEPRELNPISMFFNSLAAALKEDAIGIVLSGTGSDGALGLKAIKEEGGLTLVQGADVHGPQHDGMPSSAIATGAVDIVATVEAMPAHLVALQRAKQTSIDIASLPASQIDASRFSICEILNRHLGHDFAGYKDKTFMRRVQRRMQVLGLDTLESFIARLENDRHEVIMLFRDLLIGVTSFFRDAGTFEALQQIVIPRLFERTDNDMAIRVWVPGCATGEEAYSLAMLLCEHASQRGGAVPKMQVFATDIDEAAIATARAGRYPSTLLQGLSPERLARFFVHGIDGSYTVGKEVRELCTFSAHSLTRDPPFSRIDLVSCRNLLIYLDIDLQATVMPAFHYALVPNGILLLGSAETINRHEGLFSTVDRAHRIFQKRDVLSPPLQLTGRAGTREAQPARLGIPGTAASPASGIKLGNWAAAHVLERFSPPFVVVTAEGKCVQYSSRVTQYLEVPACLPNQDLLAMARLGLRAPLRGILKQAVESGNAAQLPDVRMTGADGTARRLTLAIEPRGEPGADPIYLIVFIEAAQTSRKRETPAAPREISSDRHLEAELRDTREHLQSTLEEHDTALEELKSANEELHSVNEELQSTNEELETSKEEIQSINEELQTVNSQLATKVDELDSNNSDLKNLFESTQVATIFLDPYMVVRSFTPAVANIYNLIPSDQGRPITDIVSRLSYNNLREDCEHVLQTLAPLERRVTHDQDHTHYLMKILPYRAPDSKVAGTIITFVNVTSIVQAEQHQRLLVDELNHRVKNMLTVVISLATQTMRRSDTMEEFAKNYTGRVHALSTAYSLLSDEGWHTVSLKDLLLEELRPFLDADAQNISTNGPLILLQPQAALAFGMAIHELTTNAVKYGALSVIGGHVEVIWSIEQNPDGDHVLLNWVERDGPLVTGPVRRGFGMQLIERGLKQDMQADVEVEFAPAGVKATLKAPLPHVDRAPA